MKDITKLAELGESYLVNEMKNACEDLAKTLARVYKLNNDSAFSCLEELPMYITGYRVMRSKLIEYGLDVSLYDEHIVSVGLKNATPLTPEGIEDCLSPNLLDRYKTYRDYFERQVAEWDSEHHP